MVGDRNYRYGVYLNIVDHGIGKSAEHSPSIPRIICRLAKRCLPNAVNSVQYFGPKGVCNKSAPFVVPKEGVSYVALGYLSDLYKIFAHKALIRARASLQGTVFTAPDRMSALRC